jgi:hypothetical protein
MKIYAAKGWQDTGYKPGAQRSAGTDVVIRAEGTWCVRNDDKALGTRDANGDIPMRGNSVPLAAPDGCPCTGEGAAAGQLIGRLGTDGAPFIVGTHCKISTNANPDDSIWLTINDTPDGLGDNEGALDVTFEAGDFLMRNPAEEKNLRIASYEKGGKKYTS